MKRSSDTDQRPVIERPVIAPVHPGRLATGGTVLGYDIAFVRRMTDGRYQSLARLLNSFILSYNAL
ncbi:hypothetical protein CP556_03655 [Natrinema sp. CBA1119]|nr:hypothetical protein CP556_03655 [Natrinema sp. CBA1119]